MGRELNEVISLVYNEGTTALRVTDVGTNVQKIIDYDVRVDDNPVYVGYGDRGIATSSALWLINKITYDGSARVTLVQSAVGVWTNRASLTYA